MWNTLGPVSVATLQCYAAINCEICSRVNSTFRRHVGQGHTFCSQYIFYMYLQKRKSCIKITMQTNWESVIASQLPSDYWVVFWTTESEKQTSTTFWANLQKEEEASYLKWSIDKDRKRKESLYMEKSRDNDQKEAHKSNSFYLLSHSSSFIVGNYSFLSATNVLSPSPKVYNCILG